MAKPKFKETDLSLSTLAPIQERAEGGGVSPQDFVQTIQMNQARRAQAAAAGAGFGGNPAMAQLQASQAAVGPTLGIMAQVAQARMMEQERAKDMVAQALLNQRRMQLQQEMARRGHSQQLQAATMAQRGGLISGLVGLGAMGLGAYSRYQQNQPSQPNVPAPDPSLPQDVIRM